MYAESTHKYQRIIQIFIAFIDKIAVVIVGHLVELVVEFNGGIAGRPRNALKDS